MSLILAVSVFGFGGSFVGVAQAVNTYTLADVAPHNTATNCWVIINNNVYNLTAFIPLHSGGQAAIIAVCGTNGTTSFNSGPHSASTINSLSSYIIGTLATTTTTPVLTSVTVNPASSSIAISGTETLVASPKDQNSLAFVGATTTFSSSNPAVATVNSTTGLVTGVTAGTVIITATSVSGSITVTGTATVVVTTTPPVVNDDDENEQNEVEEIEIDHHDNAPAGSIEDEDENEQNETSAGTGQINHHENSEHRNESNQNHELDD